MIPDTTATFVQGDAPLTKAFTVWIRRTPSGGATSFQYCCAERLIAGAPSTYAGSIKDPSGGYFNVPSKGWTTLAVGTLKLTVTVSQGNLTATISVGELANDVFASPAILDYTIATLTATGAEQKLQANLDLTCAIIPAWYASYSTSKSMALVFNNKVGTWLEVAPCATGGS